MLKPIYEHAGDGIRMLNRFVISLLLEVMKFGRDPWWKILTERKECVIDSSS
jgi:hypothetical protein